MLSSEAVIDKALLERVIAAGHSRVPVYGGDNKQVGGGPPCCAALRCALPVCGGDKKQVRWGSPVRRKLVALPGPRATRAHLCCPLPGKLLGPARPPQLSTCATAPVTPPACRTSWADPGGS